MKINFLTDNPQTIAGVNQFIENWNTHDELAVQTSGSTGIPKTITLQKAHMINSALMTGKFLGLQKDDRALLCLSVDTIGGKMMIVRSIVLDLELSVCEPSSDPLRESNEEFDFIAMVPLQVEKSLQENRALQNIGHLIIGGAPVSPTLYDRIAEQEINAFQTFGMTETISHIAMRRIDKSHPPYQTLNGVKISTDDNRLVINAPHLGVYELVTNDAVDIGLNGEFNWLGRHDFVINSGGIKIHPEQVEEKLTPLIDQPFFVAGVEDESLGNKVILCIETQTELSFEKSDFELLLDKYEIPKEIYFFQKLHYTESNKINRIKTLTNTSNAKKQVL